MKKESTDGKISFPSRPLYILHLLYPLRHVVGGRLRDGEIFAERRRDRSSGPRIGLLNFERYTIKSQLTSSSQRY